MKIEKVLASQFVAVFTALTKGGFGPIQIRPRGSFGSVKGTLTLAACKGARVEYNGKHVRGVRIQTVDGRQLGFPLRHSGGAKGTRETSFRVFTPEFGVTKTRQLMKAVGKATR